MNPAQPNVPDTRELRFQALEQAYADSLATQENMQKQINRLLHGFQQLEELMQAEKITSPSPKIQPTDFNPIQASGGPCQNHLGFIIYEVQASS